MGQLDQFTGTHAAQQAKGVGATRLKMRLDGADMVIEEQHRHEQQVGMVHRIETGLQRVRMLPVRCGMHLKHQTRNFRGKTLLHTGAGRAEMMVEGNDHHAQRAGING